MTKLAITGLEVYKTKDTNEEKQDKDSEKEGLVLHNGTITEISYYSGTIDNSFEYDYEDISANGSVSFPEVDGSEFYKGKKVCIKKAYSAQKWEDLQSVLLGFITEQNFSLDNVDLKISGMTKLLEKEEKFDFKQTKRSEILKKIIETAGLKADINVKGLKDDVIDYSNISKSSDSSEGYSGEVSSDIAEAAQQICQGCTTDLEKAKAIWKWTHDEMKYEGYSNSQKGAEKCFKDRAGNCCDHANVVVQMLKAVDVKCAYEHSSTCYGTGHVWAVAYCDGEWYRIDSSVKSRKFNQVGNGCTGTRKETLGF